MKMKKQILITFLVLVLWVFFLNAGDYGHVGGAGGGVSQATLDDSTAALRTDLAGGGGSGATEFTGLTDTPASYSGEGGKYVAVNSGATALEFVTAPSGGAADTLVMGYIYRTNASGSSKNLGNNTWTKIDTWQSTGTFVNASWDGTNKGIVVDYDGYYEIQVHLSVINSGSGTNTYTFSIGDETAARGQQISVSHDASWGYIPVSFTSFAEFDDGEPVCLWGKNGTDGDFVTISMAAMHVRRITYKR